MADLPATLPDDDAPLSRPLHRRALLGTALGTAGAVMLTERVGAQLAPPPGPIAPTGKPLADLEPRIALTQANTPGDGGAVFVISQPGSYCLTGNVSVPAGRAGVRVDVPDVALDLNGFTISGNGAAGTTGVRAFLGTNFSLQNGLIEHMDDYGVAVIGDGPCRLSDLTLQHNRGYGAVIGPSALVERIVAQLNASGVTSSPAGLLLGSDTLVRECLAYFNNGSGFRAGANVLFTDCISDLNSSDGFDAGPTSVFERCMARQNGGVGIRAQHSAVIEASTAGSNGGFGFTASFGSNLRHCAAVSNQGGGFSAWEGSLIAECVAQSNTGDGFVLNTGCVISRCEAAVNSAMGINATAAVGGAILACGARTNFEGIVAGGACLVRDNKSHGHVALGSAAIRVATFGCRVEGNLCTGSGLGMNVSASRTLVLGNNCSGNSTNWNIAANCGYGPVVNLTGFGGGAMSGNGTTASTLATSDPHANFSV